MKRNPKAQEQLKAWVAANPDTYKEMTLRQIAEASSVSFSTVNRHFLPMVAELHGISVEEVVAERKSAGLSRGGPRNKPETLAKRAETYRKKGEREAAEKEAFKAQAKTLQRLEATVRIYHKRSWWERLRNEPITEEVIEQEIKETQTQGDPDNATV